MSHKSFNIFYFKKINLKTFHAEWIEYLKRKNQSKNFEQIKNYYLKRQLRRCIKIDRKKIAEKKSDEFIIVQTEQDFNEKCRQNLDKKNIHFLIESKLNPNFFLWQKSSGPVSKLNEFIVKQDEESIEEEEIFHKNNEKLLIISAEPGMGKSLILDNFTQNSTAENFFLKIILNTCKDALKLDKTHDALDFVLKLLLNKSDHQEISLLKNLATKEEKLILMFDGLDEVTDYKEQVIQLIDALIKDKRIKKILLTTRNQLREELQDHFRTFSFNLNNFVDEDQKNFLYKYWRNSNFKHHKRATSAVLKQSAEDLITKIKSILSTKNINELIGIPLQTKMLADIYFDKETDSSSQIEIANLAELYNQFVEAKIRITQSEEKGKVKLEKFAKKYRKLIEDDFYSDHVKLSSKLLFENYNELNLDEFNDEEKCQEILEYGIVVAFTATNKTPRFLHQSFAEFFLAKSSFLKIEQNKDNDNDKELKEILRDQRHFLIRKFLKDFIEKLKFAQEHKEVNKNDEKEKEDFKKEIENCCRENLIFLLKYFIQDRGAKLKTENKFLIIASKHGHKEIVAYLIDKGIDVNQGGKRVKLEGEAKEDDESGSTALIEASHQGHTEIVRMLLENKNIEINQRDKEYRRTALILASYEGHVEIVKILLEKENIDINQKDKSGKTALMHASREGYEEIVKILLKNKNIEINHEDNWTGTTALIWASKWGHVEIVKMLLKNKNIEINQKDESGMTALMWASEYGHIEIVKLLLAKENIEINHKDTNGRPALIWASAKGHAEIVKILLKKENIDINQKDKDGKTALMWASDKGHVEIVKMLLENKNIEINQKDKDGNTALMYASAKGHVEIVKMLLEKENIEINQQDKDGLTTLMYASEEGHVEIVKMLLENKNIEINQKDKDGNTALIWASDKGHVEIVKILLEKEHIEINQQDEDGRTALMRASIRGHVEIVKILLEKDNIDINQQDEYWGKTALMFASKGHKEIVKILLQHKNIDINQKDKDGMTALTWASRNGNVDIVRMLEAKVKETKGHELKMNN
jgi:ankyrin repeat protein